MRLLIAYCAVPLHCRQTHEFLDASAQGGGKDLHVLGSVPEPAGDFPPGAVMSGDSGGGGTGWGRRQSRYLADGAAASAAAFAVYVNSAGGEEEGRACCCYRPADCVYVAGNRGDTYQRRAT